MGSSHSLCFAQRLIIPITASCFYLKVVSYFHIWLNIFLKSFRVVSQT